MTERNLDIFESKLSDPNTGILEPHYNYPVAGTFADHLSRPPDKM